MTIKDFEQLGRANDDTSLETEALQIAGFEKGAEDYGRDHNPTADADDATNGVAVPNQPADDAP